MASAASAPWGRTIMLSNPTKAQLTGVCEHKGLAVSTQLLRLHLPVKREQKMKNSILLNDIGVETPLSL